MTDRDEQKQARYAQEVKKFLDRSNSEHLMLKDVFAVTARNQYAQYQAYIAAGFTTEQAMTLLCANLKKG